METVRPLLVQGNGKLSVGVFHFDLPAVRTCPGRSRLCSSRCYATRNRYLFPQVEERLAWAYEQSKRSDFANRLCNELYRKGVILMRWHVAGDVYSPTYARKMLEVTARSAHCTFWFYTRSWRVPAILPLLTAMSALPNCKVWFSADEETGYPTEVPKGVRVAWLVTDEGEDTRGAELAFLVPALRRKQFTLPMLGTVCPTERPEGKARGTTCATCQLCWTD